jgi:hypothetical protein
MTFSCYSEEFCVQIHMNRYNRSAGDMLQDTEHSWVEIDRGEPKNVDGVPVSVSRCSSHFPIALTWELSWPYSMG